MQLTTQFILTVTEIALTQGVPAVIQAVKALRSDTPTLEEIHALKYELKDPDTFFKRDA